MTVQRKFDTLTVVATQDLSAHQFKAVTLAGAVAGTTAAAMGIQQDKPRSGDHMTIGYKGQMKAYAGGAVNSGAQLGVAASGYLVTVTASAYVGVALASASSGALVPFVGDFNMGRIA